MEIRGLWCSEALVWLGRSVFNRRLDEDLSPRSTSSLFGRLFGCFA